jgi:2',3'-cyclic-nucleotide 2'-phosphodiesterase (5'-nucleotidase family)
MRRLVLYIRLLIIAVLLFSCSKTFYLESSSFNNYPISQSLAGDDPRIISLYNPYKKNLEADMMKVVGISSVEMEKNKPESLLTNFLADLLLSEGNDYLKKKGLDYQAEISFFNYGGIRTFLPKGEITVGKIFELMPFENEMVFLKLKGTDVKGFLDIVAKKGGDSVGGVKFGIKNDTADNIIIGNNPINLNSEYWLVTNDYIADGGDDMAVFKNRIQINPSGKLIRDVILNYVTDKHKKGEVISPKLDGRIYYETSH